MKNLDKEDLPWFGSEKYLSRKSEDKRRGFFFFLFLKSSHFYLSFLIFQYGTDPVLWLQSCCFLHIPYRFVCILFQECVAGGFALGIFKWGYLRIWKPKRVEARTVIDRKIVTELPDILNLPEWARLRDITGRRKMVGHTKKKLIRRQEKSQSVCFKKEENTLWILFFHLRCLTHMYCLSRSACSGHLASGLSLFNLSPTMSVSQFYYRCMKGLPLIVEAPSELPRWKRLTEIISEKCPNYSAQIQNWGVKVTIYWHYWQDI